MVVTIALTYVYYASLISVRLSIRNSLEGKVRYFLEKADDRGIIPLEEIGKFLLVEPLQVYPIVKRLIKKKAFDVTIEGWDVCYPGDHGQRRERRSTFPVPTGTEYVPTIWRTDLEE